MRNNAKGTRVLEGILDAGPYIIIGASFLIGILSIIALLGVDIYTGKVVGSHMSKEDIFGWLISFATTGLIVAAVGVFVKGWEKEWNVLALGTIGVIVLALLGIDAYFDGISVDIKRFGEIVDTSTMLTAPEALAHNLFRILVAGVSLVGEPLATMSVMFFPVMKEFLASLFVDGEVKHPMTGGYNRPVLRPVTTPLPRPAYPMPKPAPLGQSNYQPQTAGMPAYHPVRRPSNDE